MRPLPNGQGAASTSYLLKSWISNKQSFRTCIRHYFPRRQGGSRRTVLAHITGISPLRGSLRAAPIACSRYHPGLWLDRSIIIRLLTRVGLGKPAAMRNSPPQAALWTDGHRSAPSLAVFDAVSRTGGLGASSSVASAPLPEGLSSADVSRCRIFTFQGCRGPAFGRHPVPPRFPASRPVPLN